MPTLVATTDDPNIRARLQQSKICAISRNFKACLDGFSFLSQMTANFAINRVV